MENVHLSLVLQFLSSSLRNSIYKSIISHSLPVYFWTAFTPPEKTTLPSASVWEYPHKGNQRHRFHL